MGDGDVRSSESYPGEPGAVAAARHLAARFLSRVGMGGAAAAEQTVQIVQLVVSELVTNAVRHTDGPCGVDLELTGQTVAITVWDTSPQLPVVTEHDPTRVGRHGMEIITALCGGFQVARREAGKQITVRLLLADAAV